MRTQDDPVTSPHAAAVPSAPKRGLTVGIALIAALHSFLVMLWVMPVNPITEAVGTQRLAGYIVPYFAQSWSVFAPVPRHGGENVLIRAYIGNADKTGGKLSPWFDVTADEDQRIKYLMNPARFHSASRRLGSDINANLGEFDSRSDEMLTRFATMYATARWGRGVTMVQFRVGRRDVPDYSQRNSVNFLDVPFDYYTFELRDVMPGNADAQAAFDDYVAKAPASDQENWIQIKAPDKKGGS